MLVLRVTPVRIYPLPLSRLSQAPSSVVIERTQGERVALYTLSWCSLYKIFRRFTLAEERKRGSCGEQQVIEDARANVRMLCSRVRLRRRKTPVKLESCGCAGAPVVTRRQALATAAQKLI